MILIGVMNLVERIEHCATVLLHPVVVAVELAQNANIAAIPR